MDELIRQTRQFNQAAKNLEITLREDLLQFNDMKDIIVQKNSKVKKYKMNIESGFKAHVEQIDAQIAQLEK